MSVFLATIVSVLIVGWMMIMSGVLEIVHGFQMKRWGRFFLWIVIGALYMVGGVLRRHQSAARFAVLTLFLGIFLIVAGVVRVVLAMQMRSGSYWGWVAAFGRDHAARSARSSCSIGRSRASTCSASSSAWIL